MEEHLDERGRAISIAAGEREIVTRSSHGARLTWLEWCEAEVEQRNRCRVKGALKARVARGYGRCWVAVGKF